jgi:transposase
MTRYQQLTPKKKSVAVALSKEGLSTTDISNRLNCSQSTVCRLLQRYRETGSIQRKKGSGGKFISTASQDRLLRRLAIRDRRATSTELNRAWESMSGVTCSSVTVRRRLLTAGLAARRPLKKPLLTVKMRAARLKWAREYVDKPLEFWRSTIFSDESKFCITGPDSSQYVRRRKSERFLPECLSSTVKYPTSQMVWGCISAKGVGRLHFVNGTVGAVEYIDILKSRLLRTITDHFGAPENCWFQDDSAPCHRANATKKWLQQNKIRCLPWPGNSPDLNPIENCWSVLKKRVGELKATSKQGLREALAQAWHHNLDQGYVARLIDSMPDRCRAVIKAKGGATKY